MDTSGTDAPVPWATVSVYADGFTGNALVATSDGAGWAIFNLSASTAYDVLVTVPGFSFAQHDITTGAGGTDSILIQGYDITIGSPGSPSLKRIYGYEYADSLATGPQRLEGCRVVYEITIAAQSDSVLADSALGVNYGYTYIAETFTDANGLWQIDVPLHSNLIPVALTCYPPNSTEERWVRDNLNFTDTTTLCIGSCP
jgi:hypothetical protein